MIPEAGQRFGRYEILGLLGRGGMGLVVRAWDERLHREVAIKLLHDSYGMPGTRERFLLEARAASALSHPNICTIFDIGEQDGDPYLVLELLKGETLKDRIVRGALPVEEIVRYAGEIADALAAAHAKGIVHRDIKPANIFLVAMPNGKSQAKVLDFGLAKLELEVRGGWESRTLDMRLAGATVGTLAYMSPEQARGEPLDLRSDLFSLGIVMYEMATQQNPFQGATSELMLAQLFEREPEPVRGRNRLMPRELERVILKLLAKERGERFQTAGELREALGKIGTRMRRGWLQSGAASRMAVPETPVEQGLGIEDEVEELPANETESVSAESSAKNMVIRPMRMPAGEASGERSVLHPVSAGGKKDLSGTAITAGARGESAAAPQSGSASQKDPPVGYERRRGELASARLSSGAQLEHGLTEADRDEEEAAEDAARGDAAVAGFWARWGRIGVTAVVGGVVIAAAVVFLLLRTGAIRPMILRPNEPLLLAEVENRTADKGLDGTVLEGLEIALQQSRSLDVLGEAAYRAGLLQVGADRNGSKEDRAQRVARTVKAKVYLQGEIEGKQAPYTITVDVLKTDSRDKVASLAELATSREQIPAALGRLAQKIRMQISEDGKAQARGSVGFEQDATANVDALHAYAVGEAARLDGRVEDALSAYKVAAALDPKFPQAQMRLAWMYRGERAELAAAHAAEMARAAAGQASEKVKLLARFCYEMNTTGDEGKAMAAIREYVAKYPRDATGMEGLARVLEVEGYLPESLLAAQQGYKEDPFDAEIYNEAEEAVLGLDRYDSVLQLEAQARREGVEARAGVLAAGLMRGREDVVAEWTSQMTHAMEGESGPSPSYADLDRYGRYLDATGRIGEGLELWRAGAARAEKVPELGSTAASLLARGALDRAVAESCTVALALVDELRTMPKGPYASFETGMSAALCGDQTYAEKAIVEMEQAFPQNTRVTQDYVPKLRAAADLGVNEPAKALEDLSVVERSDRAALTPYLRGMGYAAERESELAVHQFQMVLAHRGSAWRVAATLHPMAELELGRSYAVGRNKADSVAAYQRFLASWGEADRGQPLMKEALARSR